MAGNDKSRLKCYTPDAVIVSPLDWNVLACEKIPDMENDIYINSENIAYISNNFQTTNHFSAYDAGGNVEISYLWSDLPMDTTEIIDNNFFTHEGGTGEVTLIEDGIYEITAECGLKGDAVSVIEMRIIEDTDEQPNYIEIPGSKGFCTM